MTTLLLDGSVAFGLAGALYAATIAYVAVIAVTAKSAARRRDARDTLAILMSAKARLGSLNCAVTRAGPKRRSPSCRRASPSSVSVMTFAGRQRR
jgi:hypothetical protein